MPTTPRTTRPRPTTGTRPGRRLRRTTCLLGALVVLLASSGPAVAVAPAVPDHGRTLTATQQTPPTSTPEAELPDPIEVEPNWHDVPGREKIVDLLDVASQIALACCIAAIVVGGGIMGLGKLAGASRGGTVATAMVLGGGGGVILIILAPDAVAWLAA